MLIIVKCLLTIENKKNSNIKIHIKSTNMQNLVKIYVFHEVGLVCINNEICFKIFIGVTFGFVQIKVALVEILTKFSVKPNPKTRTDYTYDPTEFLARLDGGIFLDFESI